MCNANDVFLCKQMEIDKVPRSQSCKALGFLEVKNEKKKFLICKKQKSMGTVANSVKLLVFLALPCWLLTALHSSIWHSTNFSLAQLVSRHWKFLHHEKWHIVLFWILMDSNFWGSADIINSWYLENWDLCLHCSFGGKIQV